LIRWAAHSAWISDPPHLLGIGGKEHLVETLAEIRRNPVLERLGRQPGRGRPAPQIRGGTAPGLEDAEPRQNVPRQQRIGEVLAVVVDARQPRPREEVVTHQVLPQSLDLRDLREESVTTEIEAVAVVLDRLGDPADEAVCLVDGPWQTAEAEHVGGRQPGRSGSQHRRAHRFAVPRHPRPSLPASSPAQICEIRSGGRPRSGSSRRACADVASRGPPTRRREWRR
jgi:hypothetical protein